jgi:nuclear transcription factor Y, gamma
MTKPYVQSGEPLHEFLHSFWQRQVDAAEQETPDYRHPPLPLARIKKVMKSDPDVKVLFFPLSSFSFLVDIRPPPR